MGSVSSEEGFESYSLSADVSESESSGTTGFSCRRFEIDQKAGSTNSLTSSPLVVPDLVDGSSFTKQVPVMSPVVGGRHVVIHENKPKLLDLPDVSGEFTTTFSIYHVLH